MTFERAQPAKGRGAAIQPANRFEPLSSEDDFEHFEHEERTGGLRTEFLSDESKSIISENDSPDVGFRYSLNPYRGCEHGCAYCYARPTHEYYGLSAGLDFESKIFVKHHAPELFREWLARDAWQPEVIIFSGVTDCYQPAERRFRLTRACLEVALEARQPISIISKNALVARDLDLLAQMAERRIAQVGMSVTSLDADLARSMEPRTSSPEARFRTIATLAAAGVPVTAMVAPIVPGLNDSEIPALLEAARDAGAQAAGMVLLRLPLAVRPVFLDWLKRAEPTRAARVKSLIRSTRGGKLNDASFGTRMKGTGQIAQQIRDTFKVFRRKFGLDSPLPELDASNFQPPRVGRQMRLF